MSTRRDDLHDLIAAYALDSLDADEKRRAEVALAADAALRRELDDHHAVLAALADAVDPYPSTPSPAVWENIMAQIDGAGDVGPKLPSITELRTQRRFSRVTAAISVAAIAFVAVLGVSVVRLQQERTEPTVEVAISELLDDPSATVVTLAAAAGMTGEARIVLGADGVGYVYADSLPVLAENRTYQLWAIVDDRVISAGVLGNDPDNSPFQVVGDIAGFAITDEVAGGVPVSEGDTVAVWLRNA